MKRLSLCLCFICYIIVSNAQPEKKVVAIMPFLSTVPENRNYAGQLQSIALQTFVSKSYVTFVDRSTDAMVIKELDNQIREQSISSKVLVEQGKLTGSTEIIVGSLLSVGLETKEVTSLTGGSDKKYIGNVSFSLQVIDAATGILKTTKDFNGNTHKQDLGGKLLGGVWGKVSNALMADTKDEAIRKAIAATKNQIADWIADYYAPNIRIFNIASRDKKGYPELVKITGFESALSTGKKITITEITMVDDGIGGKIKQEIKFGELRVSEILGQVVICKVKKGEDVLEEKMKTTGSLKYTIE